MVVQTMDTLTRSTFATNATNAEGKYSAIVDVVGAIIVITSVTSTSLLFVELLTHWWAAGWMFKLSGNWSRSEYAAHQALSVECWVLLTRSVSTRLIALEGREFNLQEILCNRKWVVRLKGLMLGYANIPIVAWRWPTSIGRPVVCLVHP